jgi:hypothetical protein
MKIIQITVCLLIVFSACKDRTNNNNSSTLTANSEDGIPLDTPSLSVKNYNGRSDSMFAFVGEKIALEKLPPNSESGWDETFKATYKILKKVYGDFPGDTIEFVVYDHLGHVFFSKFNYVLLYVSADSGTYYHKKYQFTPVSLTKEGRWAGLADEDVYELPANVKAKIKPVKIPFAEEAWLPTKISDKKGELVPVNCPAKYFKVEGDKAIPVYGNYVEELIILNRNEELTRRAALTEYQSATLKKE